MHVIQPATYKPRPKPHRRRRWPGVFLGILVLIGLVNYSRPLPATTASLSVPGLKPGVEPAIAWPGSGQAAIGAPGYGVLATNGAQTPVATASTAKVIAALCVLQKKPLARGQNGPTYTITADDVATYNDYTAQNGSVIPVTLGERLTERQALEAMMIPSANNIADSLVRWVFGNHDAYASYAQNYLAAHGLAQTHIGTDASGFDPSTTSTAGDLTKLGLLALQNPVLMDIAGQTSTTLPVIGTVDNYDTVLGVNGVTGLKTGNSDADDGAFVFTATITVDGKQLPVAGAVMEAPDLGTALHSGTQLAASLQEGFNRTVVAKAGQQLGALTAPWGASVPIAADQSLGVVRWQGSGLQATHQLKSGVFEGTIGKLQVSAGQASASSGLSLGQPLAGPSFWWRLTRR